MRISDWSSDVCSSDLRVDPTTGAWQTLYETCDGRRLKGPNDIVFDRTGGFWFTDMGKAGDDTIDRGALYYARPDGSSILRADEIGRASCRERVGQYV